MGIKINNKPKVLSKLPDSNQMSKIDNKANSKASSPTSQEPATKISNIGSNSNESLNLEKDKNIDNIQKRHSITSHDEISMGNSTLHSKPEKLPQLKNSKSSITNSNVKTNPHYDDTMFGDELPRTYSPNELDSLRHVYQNNAISDDERESRDQNNEIVDENINNDEDVYGSDNDPYELSENTKNENFQNYNATTKSEDEIVVGNKDLWDPNGTRSIPKEGDKNNVIIEISNFTLKENSQVLQRDEIQQLFVGMEFLNYDPADLESKSSMPKPLANQPCHFNFRQSIFFLF